MSASPSTPAGTGRRRDLELGADHWRQARTAAVGRLVPRASSAATPSTPRRSAGACPSRPPGRAGSGCWRRGSPRPVAGSARPGPVQRRCRRPRSVGAERVGDGVEQRAQLRVAVPVALHRLGVEAERDVVDEHAAVDLGEVHPALAAVDERVERADDVVAVDAEVEREVVAGARRNAGVRQTGSAAIAATIACEPSPPAIASASAPPSTASRTSAPGRRRGFSSIGSIPRARASSASGQAPCRRPTWVLEQHRPLRRSGRQWSPHRERRPWPTPRLATRHPIASRASRSRPPDERQHDRRHEQRAARRHKRDALRRPAGESPAHATRTATKRIAAMMRPRGNDPTALSTARTAAATSSARVAIADRRLMTPCQRRDGWPPSTIERDPQRRSTPPHVRRAAAGTHRGGGAGRPAPAAATVPPPCPVAPDPRSGSSSCHASSLPPPTTSRSIREASAHATEILTQLASQGNRGRAGCLCGDLNAGPANLRLGGGGTSRATAAVDAEARGACCRSSTCDLPGIAPRANDIDSLSGST